MFDATMAKAVVMVAFLLAFTRGAEISLNCNDNTVISKEAYKKEVLGKFNGIPNDIAIGRNIYVTAPSSLRNFVIYSIQEKVFFDMIMVRPVVAVAVDLSSNKVYFGTEMGLQMFEEDTAYVLKFLQGISQNFVDIFIPKNGSVIYGTVKCSNGPKYEVYKYDIETLEGVNLNITNAKKFVVDLQGNYYYIEETEDLFHLKVKIKRQSSILAFSEYSDVNSNIDELAVDNYGRVFGLTAHALYRLYPDNSDPQLVTTLDFHATNMDFDINNDIIFATSQSELIKLQFNKCVPGSGNERENTVDNLDPADLGENLVIPQDTTANEFKTMNKTLNIVSNQIIELKMQNIAIRTALKKNTGLLLEINENVKQLQN